MDDDDDDGDDGEAEAVVVATNLQNAMAEKRKETLKRVNGCGDALKKAEAEEAEGEGEEDAAAAAAPSGDQKKKANLFSRLGLRSGKQTRPPRLEIVTPWRVEPTAAAPAPTTSPQEKEAPKALEVWPSLASLHCIGWAKVITTYKPQKPGELALLEGVCVCGPLGGRGGAASSLTRLD